MIEVQSAFRSCEARCFMRPSLRYLMVCLSFTGRVSSIVVLAVDSLAAVGGGCGVAGVIIVDGAAGVGATACTWGAGGGTGVGTVFVDELEVTAGAAAVLWAEGGR